MIKPAEKIEQPKRIIFKLNQFLITRQMIWLPKKSYDRNWMHWHFDRENAQKTLLSPLGEPIHRGAFCQFPFRWIYYCHSIKSSGKETGKIHLCAMLQKSIKMQRKPMSPTFVWKSIPWNGIAFTKLASWSKDPAIHSKATIFFASPFCDFILTFKTMMHIVK